MRKKFFFIIGCTKTYVRESAMEKHVITYHRDYDLTSLTNQQTAIIINQPGSLLRHGIDVYDETAAAAVLAEPIDGVEVPGPSSEVIIDGLVTHIHHDYH